MFRKQRIHSAVTVVALVALFPSYSRAQQEPPQTAPAAPATPASTDFITWEKAKVLEAMKTVAPQEAVARNGNGVSNQVEAPSVDQASTSLVDTSSASDFVSTALSVTGLGIDQGGSSTPRSGSVTATLYSLIAAAKGIPVTDPAFYKAGTKWRRTAFTVGTEESKADEDFTDKPSTNLGVKFLAINDRDIYSTAAQENLQELAGAVGDFQDVDSEDTKEIECIIFKALRKKDACLDDNREYQDFLLTAFNADGWPETEEQLKADTRATEAVDRVIARSAAARQVASDKVARSVQKIQSGRQLSFAYYAKLREDQGTDGHRVEMIFDLGMTERLNWTVNAGVDYLDRKTTKDSRNARVATELQAKLSNPGGDTIWRSRPVTLAASAEATRASGEAWLVKAQAKLLIPIMTGVNVPIAYTYANRSADGVSAGSRLKVSLAVDPVRFREWLASSAEQRHGNQ